VDLADVRRVVATLDGVQERPHHGIASFRARTIFATLPDDGTLRVMLDEGQIREAAAEFPRWARQRWWGRRLAAVEITLADADPTVVAEWLSEAHQQHS
jgi:hypothetical protein